MAGFSDYLEKKLLDHVFGGSAYTSPATLYFGLATATITDATTGTTVTEPSGGSYARVGVTNNTTNFPAASGTTATKKNGTVINFPEATASWGKVTHFFIADAATGGNILAYAALDSSKTIDKGDLPRFNANALTITLD